MATVIPPAPSEARTVEVAGLALNYLDYGGGPGPVMLCVHGGAAHAHWFDYAAAEFTGHCRVLSLDLRGHGDSEWAPDGDYSYLRYAADVAELVDILSLGPVVLCGHSMGGMVSLVVAATCPEKTAALVVVDSMMKMTPERASTLRGIGEGKGRSFESREAFVAGFKVRPNGSVAPPEVVRQLAFNSCRIDEHGRWRNKFDRNVYARRHPIDGYEYWGRVGSPVLLVAGSESDRVTPEVLGRIRAACPHVAHEVVEGAGHHVTIDRPEGYRSAVRRFLEARDLLPVSRG